MSLETGEPPQFTIRSAALADLDAVCALRQLRERAESGESTTTTATLAAEWVPLGDYLGERVWIAAAPTGDLIASVELARLGATFNPRLWSDLGGRPTGPERALLAAAETQARLTGGAEG